MGYGQLRKALSDCTTAAAPLTPKRPAFRTPSVGLRPTPPRFAGKEVAHPSVDVLHVDRPAREALRERGLHERVEVAVEDVGASQDPVCWTM